MQTIKLIYANYDKESGVSTALIETDLGRFTATSKLREEDREVESSYCGCRYAELKAVRKYLQALLRVKKAEFKCLHELYIGFCLSDKTNSGSREFVLLERAVDKKRKEIRETKEGIKKIGKNISLAVAERDKIHKRIQESRAKEIKE